jgi:DNA polymerase IV
MKNQHYWKKAIILLDMNAFFSSIEQREFPELQGKPIGITNGMDGTCIITCSYEARSFGIKTGMRLKDALKLCPYLIQRPARPKCYVEISTRIMKALNQVTPDIEVFSVDEAFLDVTHCQQLWGSPIKMGKMVKQIVYDASGLMCSVGVSGNKTTAKFAAKCQKPNGFTVIPPWEARERLRNVPVTDLCGIATGIGNFLARHGVINCGDMERLPISVLAKRFGNIGRRIWYMCQGEDPEPLRTQVAAPKTMGHGKVVPPNTIDPNVILTFLLHMSEKLAARLRRYHMQAHHFFVGLRSYTKGWLGNQLKTIYPTCDGREIFKLCKVIYYHYCLDEPVSQVQVTALDPKPQNNQLDFFQDHDFKREQVNEALDAVNSKYGEFVLAPARLLQKSDMPNVIAPSWKPEGHRQIIPTD